jgi:hypothetical protein
MLKNDAKEDHTALYVRSGGKIQEEEGKFRAFVRKATPL